MTASTGTVRGAMTRVAAHRLRRLRGHGRWHHRHVGLFAELQLPADTPVDRDELEEAVIDAFEGMAEVTGAGTGSFGSNLDIQFDGALGRDDIVTTVKTVLASRGVEQAKLHFEGLEEWIGL